ncbi:MAG: imidazole glycerol phosphate synthase subunit HisH [Solirubrobacterales bacterium]
MSEIAIVDYGMGNLRSAAKALERVGARVEVTRDHRTIAEAAGVVLPGVGAFGEAMRHVNRLGLAAPLAERVASGGPLLGICLGLQLLFDGSDEHGGHEGLGFVGGWVRRLEAPGLKVPHIGWEPVRWTRATPLTDGIDDGTPFYLVHSYAVQPADPADTIGEAAFGDPFCCAVQRGPVHGVQFHPEKSSSAGLALLRNFVALCGAPAPA